MLTLWKYPQMGGSEIERNFNLLEFIRLPKTYAPFELIDLSELPLQLKTATGI